MKRFLILVLFFVFVLPVNALEFDIKSTNAILYNYNLDEVIYEKNSNEKVKIASLTKIMTTTVAIENIDNLNEEVTITYEMLKGLIEENASVVGYRIGDRITYKDLLYGSLLPSGADATRALAISIAGSEEEYVKLMNKKAKELNMNNTIFTNSSGLDTDNQYSTVSDVLILLKYALQNETFKEIYTTFQYKDLNSTLNKLLNNYNIQNKYIKGAKTGYTDLAGYCLSSYSNDNNIEYLLITTGVYEDYPYSVVDHNQMLSYVFENYKYGEIKPIIKIDNKYSNEDIEIKFDTKDYLYKDKIYYEYEGLSQISYKDKNKLIGTLKIYIDDDIEQIDVYAPNDIEINYLLILRKYFYIPVILIVLGGIYGYRNHRRRTTRNKLLHNN